MSRLSPTIFIVGYATLLCGVSAIGSASLLSEVIEDVDNGEILPDENSGAVGLDAEDDNTSLLLDMLEFSEVRGFSGSKN